MQSLVVCYLVIGSIFFHTRVADWSIVSPRDIICGLDIMDIVICVTIVLK